jgi:hypothetical protein
MGTTVKDDYVADTDPLLKNPERGMYFGSRPNTPEEFHTIVPKWLWLAPWCDKDLVWDPTNPDNTSQVLKDYGPGTPAAPGILESARLNGYKILFRPRYDKTDDPNDPDFDPNDPNGPSDCTFEGGNAKVFHADSRARQKNHITAIANMLASYRDVIAYIQAGYLGKWGEWNWDPESGYTSANAPLLADIAFRKEIIDWMIDEYDRVGIMQHVEFRRPVFAREVLMRKPNARIGSHNDCFMSNDDDHDTYENFDDCDPSNDPACPNFASPDEAYLWAAETLTATASFGGETCGESGSERWRTCSNMTGPSSEPASLHMNYLNGDWHKDAVTVWSKSVPSCYDDIRRNLGYRFEVTCVEYTETVSAGETFSVAVDVKNTGWARLHKPRDAKLVLRNGGTPLEYTFSGGPVSNWAPGTPTTISVSDSAPPPGTYSVWLWIPDPDLLEFLSTSPNPEDYKNAKTNYAVKLATKRNGVNVFDQTTGENNLGVEIKLQ